MSKAACSACVKTKQKCRVLPGSNFCDKCFKTGNTVACTASLEARAQARADRKAQRVGPAEVDGATAIATPRNLDDEPDACEAHHMELEGRSDSYTTTEMSYKRDSGYMQTSHQQGFTNNAYDVSRQCSDQVTITTTGEEIQRMYRAYPPGCIELLALKVGWAPRSAC